MNSTVLRVHCGFISTASSGPGTSSSSAGSSDATASGRLERRQLWRRTTIFSSPAPLYRLQGSLSFQRSPSSPATSGKAALEVASRCGRLRLLLPPPDAVSHGAFILVSQRHQRPRPRRTFASAVGVTLWGDGNDRNQLMVIELLGMQSHPKFQCSLVSLSRWLPRV